MLKLRMVDRNILDHYTDLPVGEVLRRARIQFGLELPYVAAHLNIRPEHLAAIEAGDITRLPGRVYAIGFVRTYAEYLRLDSDKIVYLFKSQVIGHTIARDLNFPIPVTETRSPAWWMVAASFGTLAIIAGLFWIVGGNTSPEAKPEMPAVVAQTKPEAKPEIPLMQITPAAGDVIPAADGKLKITAKSASWVEVRSGDDPDDILFSRVLKAGESYTAPTGENLSLSTGNAEGIVVFWGGKQVDVFEGRKGIVRNLPVSGLTAYKIRAEEPAPAIEPLPATQAQ
jgi:cytoskeleton protein RodZ